MTLQKLYIAIFAFTLSFNCLGQDTIKLDESIVYSKLELSKLGGKGNPVKYGKEAILINSNHQIIQFCNYIDGVRNCNAQEEYKIESDSILKIFDSNNLEIKKWHFKKESDTLYYVYRKIENTYEFAYTSKLIPLEPPKIYTTNLSRSDTLWTTILNNNRYIVEFHKTKLNGKLYEYYQIDDPPFNINGDTLGSIIIPYIIACYSDPITTINTVAITVTNTGNIVNIEQTSGNISQSCPYTMQEINKKLKKWGTLIPAKKNGKPVNVRWFIKIDDLSRDKIHPIFLDNKKNRKRYIKNKRKAERKANRSIKTNE